MVIRSVLMISLTFLIFLFKTETLNWEEIINLDRGKLQKLHSECHSLKELLKVINKDNKEDIRTRYFIDDGILIRSWKERNSLSSAVNQIIVPKVLRNEILRLGHQSALSANLGIHKTCDRISNHLFGQVLMLQLKLLSDVVTFAKR